MTDIENIEWYFEVTVAGVPEPTTEQMEEMMSHIGGVVSWHVDAERLRFVFRRTTPCSVWEVMTDVRIDVGLALNAVLGYAPWQLRHHVREFTIRRAEDVPVDPEVQRWADALTKEDPS